MKILTFTLNVTDNKDIRNDRLLIKMGLKLHTLVACICLAVCFSSTVDSKSISEDQSKTEGQSFIITTKALFIKECLL